MLQEKLTLVLNWDQYMRVSLLRLFTTVTDHCKLMTSVVRDGHSQGISRISLYVLRSRWRAFNKLVVIKCLHSASRIENGLVGVPINM